MERLLDKLKQSLRSIGRDPHGTVASERPDREHTAAPRLRTELDPACPPASPTATAREAQAASPQPRVSDARTKRATLARAARRVLQENTPSLWGVVAGRASDVLHGPSAEGPPLLSGATLVSCATDPRLPARSPAPIDTTSVPEQPFLAGAPSFSPPSATAEPPVIDVLAPAADLSARQDDHYDRPF